MKAVATYSSLGNGTTRCLALLIAFFVALTCYSSSFPAIRRPVGRSSSVMVDFGSGGGAGVAANPDLVCNRKRIYIHKLPPEFNEMLLHNCATVQLYEADLCRNLMNDGFGPRVEFGSQDPLRHTIVPNEAWFETDQFTLELIVHSRLKRYRCLTEDPEAADFFFLPYYAGVDLMKYIFTPKVQMRDRLTQRLIGWLEANPYWNRRQGRDHILALSRIVWDYHREADDEGGWGSCLLTAPELKNVTKLIIERELQDQMAVPYPTSFHPRSTEDVKRWQSVVRESERPYRVSFTGGPRVMWQSDPNHPKKHIRELILNQCEQSSHCKMFECRRNVDCAHNQYKMIASTVLKSVFCLQPPGDSPTRKATFDSLLAACIPVFISPNSAYTQYLWHLPADRDTYSVFFNEDDVIRQQENQTGFGVNVPQALASIPEEKVRSMRETIVNLIPLIVYAHSTHRDGAHFPPTTADSLPGEEHLDFKDAFDVMVEGLLKRPRGQDY